MSKTWSESNSDRIEAVLARRRSNAAGPHPLKTKKVRGGRNGAKAALRRQAVSA